MAYSTPDFSLVAGRNVTKKILDNMVTLSAFLDFSVTANNVTASLYYKVFVLPAYFYIKRIDVICHTAEGATGTIDIVDDDSASTTYVNDFNVNSAGGDAQGSNVPLVLTAAGQIVLMPNHDLDAAKIWVLVQGIALNTSM